jgi:hypothetical protein
MLTRILSIAYGISFVLVAACSAPPARESVGRGSTALDDGSSTTYPIVQITDPNTGSTCSGTAIADRWVLTSVNCASIFIPTGGSSTLQVCRQSTCANGTARMDTASGAALLQLDRSVTSGPYPLISNYPVSDVYPLTCAGMSQVLHVAEQASFAISQVTPYSFYATPIGPATPEFGDMGGGCFAGNNIYGVLTSCSANGCVGTPSTGAPPAAPVLADFVYANVGPAPFCGSASCGLYQAGSHQISCGTCVQGMTCNAGSCVTLPPPPPPPPPTCPHGMKDCGDGTCVPQKVTCM